MGLEVLEQSGKLYGTQTNWRSNHLLKAIYVSYIQCFPHLRAADKGIRGQGSKQAEH